VTQHARLFSPSGAHRWLRCPGAPTLEATQPESSSAYAEAGTWAHDLAAQMLLGATGTLDGLSDELAQCVLTYVERIREYAQGHELFVEQRVDFSATLGIEGGFGTADAIIVAGNELQLHDMKTGRGVRVEADENPQLMLYALGALEAFSLAGDFDSVRLVIHQPPLNNLSEWSISVTELREWAKVAKLAAAKVLEAAEAGGDDAYLSPGEKQCRFCRAKAVCPALQAHVHETVVASFDDLEAAVLAAPVADGDHIAEQLSQVDLIEQWCSAIRERAYSLLAEGQTVPGFKLVQGRAGIRKWSNEAKAAELLQQHLEAGAFDVSLISPTTAEKKLKASKTAWADLQPFITQAPGRPSVAPANDPRPPIAMVASAEDFEALA
jgi:hypothetical protein